MLDITGQWPIPGQTVSLINKKFADQSAQASSPRHDQRTVE
jgi:hypothetical protein